MHATVRGQRVELDHVADVEPTGAAGKRGQLFSVTLDGERIIESSVIPSLDACRVLQARGLSGRIGFRQDGMMGLVMGIAWGAAHTVSERSGSPRFDKWQPYSVDRL